MIFTGKISICKPWRQQKINKIDFCAHSHTGKLSKSFTAIQENCQINIQAHGRTGKLSNYNLGICVGFWPYKKIVKNVHSHTEKLSKAFTATQENCQINMQAHGHTGKLSKKFTATLENCQKASRPHRKIVKQICRVMAIQENCQTIILMPTQGHGHTGKLSNYSHHAFEVHGI